MTEQPEPIPTEPVALRDRIADALTAAAAHDCDATCGLDERACYAHPITWSALVALPPGTFHIDGPVTAIADVVLAVLRAPVGPDDPGTEAVSPQARPGRPTASTVTDDQLDALHAALDRVRQLADAISDGRALTASLDDIADRIRQAIDGTTPAWEPRLSHEDLRGGFAPGLTGGLCSVCHIARVLGGWSGSLGAGTGNDAGHDPQKWADCIAALDESDDTTQEQR